MKMAFVYQILLFIYLCALTKIYFFRFCFPKQRLIIQFLPYSKICSDHIVPEPENP